MIQTTHIGASPLELTPEELAALDEHAALALPAAGGQGSEGGAPSLQSTAEAVAGPVGAGVATLAAVPPAPTASSAVPALPRLRPPHLFHYVPFPAKLDASLYHAPRPEALCSYADSLSAQHGPFGGLFKTTRELQGALKLRPPPLDARGSVTATMSSTPASLDRNVFFAWFLVFVASLDIVTDEIARRAGAFLCAAAAAAYVVFGRI